MWPKVRTGQQIERTRGATENLIKRKRSAAFIRFSVTNNISDSQFAKSSDRAAGYIISTSGSELPSANENDPCHTSQINIGAF